MNANVNIKSLSPEGDLLETVEGGYVNIADSYRIGMQPTISAVAFDGFEFSHWEDSEDNIFSTSKITTLEKLTEDIKINAVFKTKSYDIDFFVSPLAGGHLFIQGTKVIGNYKLKVNHGEYILITAVANPSYTFKKWDAEYGVIDLPSLKSASVRVTSNAKITALLSPMKKLI